MRCRGGKSEVLARTFSILFKEGRRFLGPFRPGGGGPALGAVEFLVAPQVRTWARSRKAVKEAGGPGGALQLRTPGGHGGRATGGLVSDPDRQGPVFGRT